MEQNPLLLAVAVACLAASVVWGRSALRFERTARRIEMESHDPEVSVLARATVRRDAHAALLYWLLALSTGFLALGSRFDVFLALMAVPVLLTFRIRGRVAAEAA